MQKFGEIIQILQEPKMLILLPDHVFKCVKVFIFTLVPGPGGLQLLIISMCFAWHPVKNINEPPRGKTNK